MPLFQRRQREAERAVRPPKLTEAVPAAARGQIGHALVDHVVPGSGIPFAIGINVTDWMILNDELRWVLMREWGVANLPQDDVRNVVLKATNAEVLDVVEAWYPAARRVVEKVDSASGVYYVEGSSTVRVMAAVAVRYRETINDIFDDRDVAWQLVGERVVPRSSAAMHTQIVEPVFALTTGRPELAAVEQAYQKALLELKPSGDPADAITAASTALQEMLVAAGARGDSLGPLLTEARKRELLGPYDSKLAEGIDALGSWVSADRSQRGGTHRAGDATRDDAWLAVRVAGALILRLAAGRKR